MTQLYEPIMMREAVTNAVNTSWFTNNLYKGKNTFGDNEKLERYSNVKVTFENIRRNPAWKEISKSIISQEIDVLEGDFHISDSYYYTWIHAQLCSIIQRRVISSTWAEDKVKKALIKYTRLWVAKRFAPGGIGYEIARSRFILCVSKC